MDCWHCGSELIWGGDHDYEDWAGEVEGEGIVSNFSCPTCPAVVYVYLPIEEEEESTETLEGFICDIQYFQFFHSAVFHFLRRDFSKFKTREHYIPKH